MKIAARDFTGMAYNSFSEMIDAEVEKDILKWEEEFRAKMEKSNRFHGFICAIITTVGFSFVTWVIIVSA